MILQIHHMFTSINAHIYFISRICTMHLKDTFCLTQVLSVHLFDKIIYDCNKYKKG